MWGLAELGAVAEAVARGEEGVRIAEAVDQPWDLLAAYRSAGLVCLGKGDVQRAILWLERCLQLCQDWDIAGWFAVIASQLGYAYALSGQMDKALPLLLFQLACGYPLYILRQFARELSAENLFGFLALERFDQAESITLFVNNAKRYG